MLALLGGSFGVAKSAAAAPPEHHAAVAAVVHDAPRIREHFAELEVDSGEVRSPLEARNLATARPQSRSAVGGGRPDHQPPQR